MRTDNLKNDSVLGLQVGTLVEIRSQAEIIATLDENGSLESLPFMPEMLQFCGKRFRVFKRADKACDTIGKTGSRRMENAVHLEGARCDGVAHGGCQASCLIYWKEAWLKPVVNPSEGSEIVEEAKSFKGRSSTPPQHKSIASTDTLFKATRRENDATIGNEEVFACQATELTKATSYLAWWDVRQYVRDVRSGNISLQQLLRGLAIAAFNMTIRNVRRGALAIMALAGRLWRITGEAQKIPATAMLPSLGIASSGNGMKEKVKALYNDLLVEYPHIRGKMKKTPSAVLNLQPGDVVQVKSKQQILETLDANNKNRGLLFDVEMLPYCGKSFRVLRRVERIVNEKTGRMIRMPNDCLILEGVTCGGCLSSNRLFCPRSIYPYWREIWLKRVG
jgi:hypothetical protein